MSGVGKPTTCKDAIRRWEEATGLDASSATEINLSFQWPPIEKMDNAFNVISKCEKLTLSTNMIEKIAGISALKNLKILSIGRNLIKAFSGLEPLGDTLEELWISYNSIEKMKGITCMKNLRVLYISNNLIREWNELSKLSELPNLRDLLFVGNPLCDGFEVNGKNNRGYSVIRTLRSDDPDKLFLLTLGAHTLVSENCLKVQKVKTEAWKAEVARRLPNLEKLDGELIIRSEDAAPSSGQLSKAECPPPPLPKSPEQQ